MRCDLCVVHRSLRAIYQCEGVLGLWEQVARTLSCGSKLHTLSHPVLHPYTKRPVCRVFGLHTHTTMLCSHPWCGLTVSISISGSGSVSVAVEWLPLDSHRDSGLWCGCLVVAQGKVSCAQAARPYESCKNIQGLAPPRCPFEAGTTVVHIISTRQISAWRK